MFNFLRIKKKTLVFLTVVLLVAGFIFRGRFSGSSETTYQTTKVERGTLVVSVSASGQVVTTGRLPVLSQASGQVREVYVKNGDKVVAGQKILSLTLDPVASQKNASAWSSYLAANAAFYSTQSTMFSKWKTFKDLAESSSYDTAEERTLPQFHIAKNDWLKAEADYKNQQAVVAAAWLTYQQTSPDLTAPASGIISDLTYVPGMLVSSAVSSGITQSQTIASIHTLSTPTITVNLAEADVNKVAEKNKAVVTFDALPDKTFPGKLVGINKTGVVTSGVTNYPATIQLDTNPPEILPNMSASASIIIASKNDALLVPSAAVQNNSVKVLRRNQLQNVPVQIGLSSDTQTEIVSGLSEGDEVITGTATTTPGATGTSPFNTFRFGAGLGGGGTRTGGR